MDENNSLKKLYIMKNAEKKKVLNFTSSRYFNTKEQKKKNKI